MSWLPSVVALNCIDDYAMEQDHFSGVAAVKHVPLSHLADGRIDSASAVVLQSFAYLPCAAQRRLRPYQLILCLGSGDCSTDSTFTADLGCQSSMAGFPAFTATKMMRNVVRRHGSARGLLIFLFAGLVLLLSLRRLICWTW